MWFIYFIDELVCRKDRMFSKLMFLKVVLFGDGGVGKLLLMNWFVSGKFDS